MIRSQLRRLSRGLVGHAAIYVGAAAANAAIPFMLLPLIARWLGPSDFGVIGSFVAIVNVLILLVGLNAYGFVSVGYYRDGAQTLPGLTGAAVRIVLAASLAVGLAGWIGAGAIERLVQIDRAWLWTLLAAAAGQAVLAIGLTVAQTIRKPLVYSVFQVGYGLLLGLLAILFVGVVGMGWQGRALAQSLAALAMATGALAWLRSTGRISVAVDGKMLRRALGFGLPLLPHSFAAVAMGSMDRLALGGRFPPAVVGYYFLALQIAGAFTAFAAAVNQAWIPWLYERLARNDAAASKEISQTIRIGGTLLAVAVAAMALLAGPLVLLVGGPSYLPATTPLRLLAGYAGCQAWYTLMSAFLFYAERPRLLSTLTVSTAAAQGALILVMMPWGAVGVAGALLASAMGSAAVMSIVAYRLAGGHRAAALAGAGR